MSMNLYSDPSDPSYKEKIEALLLETDNLANTNAEANAPNLDFKTKERHKRSASWDSSNKNIPSGQNPRGRKQPQPPLDAIEIGHNIQIHQMIHNSVEQPNVADYSGEQFQPSSWGNRQPDKSLYKQRRAGLNVAFLMEDRKKTSYLKKLSRKKRTPFKFEIRGYFSHDSSSSSESDESSEESEDDGRSMEDCSTESGDYATKEQDNRRDRNRGKASQWSGRQLMKKKNDWSDNKDDDDNDDDDDKDDEDDDENDDEDDDDGYNDNNDDDGQDKAKSVDTVKKIDKGPASHNDSVVSKNVTVYSGSVRMKMSQTTTLKNATNILYLVLPSKYNVSDNSLVAITGNNTIVITQNMVNIPEDLKAKALQKGPKNTSGQFIKTVYSNSTRWKRFSGGGGGGGSTNEDDPSTLEIFKSAISKILGKRESNDSVSTTKRTTVGETMDGKITTTSDAKIQPEENVSSALPIAEDEDQNAGNMEDDSGVFFNYAGGPWDYLDEGLWTEYLEILDF